MQRRRTQRIPEQALEAGNKGKHSSSMGPKCGQTRPRKLVGARTKLTPGVNGTPRLSAETEKNKRIINLNVWRTKDDYKFFDTSSIKRYGLFLHSLNLVYTVTPLINKGCQKSCYASSSSSL